MPKTAYDQWADTFRPITNHILERESCDGLLFETFGAELDFVLHTQALSPLNVWTMVEGDEGDWYVSQGFHLVNRIGYFVTEVPFDPSDPVQARTYGNADVLYD